MTERASAQKKSSEPTDKLLPRLTLKLFSLPRIVALAWIALLVFGILSYSVLLRREGFPSVNIPVIIVNGTYIVNDPAKVDSELAKPISEIALRQDGASQVVARSAGNFVSIFVQYEQGTDSKDAITKLEGAVKSSGVLPTTANMQFNAPYFGATGPAPKKIDAAVSFFAKDDAVDTAENAKQAEAAVAYLNAHKPDLVAEYFVQQPFESAVNPSTGQVQTVQKTFDYYGSRENGATNFRNSVIIGVTAVDDVDVIKLDRQLEQAREELLRQPEFQDYDARISASFAPSIEESITELQRVLLEGLLAVLVVGSIVIAIRASLITVISMVTVITATLGLLYLLGYTLNVITLFALILGLSLIVDDTIIMVEAIDSARRKTKSPREAVRIAVRKISRAMVAATSTAALSFLPLAFLGGILGSFIRAVPITIISALVISLFVALVFIPLFARILLLGKKQMGEEGVTEIAAGVEKRIAHGLTRPLRWARGSSWRLWTVGLSAVAVGVLFMVAAGAIFGKVTFNLFPPSKDTNALSVSMTMPPGTSITQAQELAAKVDDVVAAELGKEFKVASYYGQGTSQTSVLNVELTPYSERGPTARTITQQLQERLNRDMPQLVTTVTPIDVGPPLAAFNVQIKTEDRVAGYRLAHEIANYMKTAELTRTSGTTARFTNVTVSSESTVIRAKGAQVIEVTAGFDADDTTTLVTLAQDSIKKEFTKQRVEAFGLSENVVGFDIGQEADNQESFKGLLIAFPIVLAAILILLAIEFRSLLQPLLIFLAIPFSLFGVTLGLYLTDNAFSFFVAMGFFALIGLSIKNTILVVDYANQSRRAGLGPIDSVTAALEERFRPLIATSLTAVVSLIPLALTSPFWQGLSIVLIGGLLSSTFLVVTVFPYYYLGGEYLRLHVRRGSALLWLFSVGVVTFGIANLVNPATGLGVGLILAVLWPIAGHYLPQLVIRRRGGQ